MFFSLCNFTFSQMQLEASSREIFTYVFVSFWLPPHFLYSLEPIWCFKLGVEMPYWTKATNSDSFFFFSLRWRTKRYLPPGSLKGWQESRWCGKPCAPLFPGDIKSTARCTMSEVLQKCFFPKTCKPQSLGLFRRKPHFIWMQQRTGIKLFWNVYTVEAHGHSSGILLTELSLHAH